MSNILFPSFSHQDDFLRFGLKLASLLPMQREGGGAGGGDVSWESVSVENKI